MDLKSHTLTFPDSIVEFNTGNHVIQQPLFSQNIYNGFVISNGKELGWARLRISNAINNLSVEGSFTTGNEMYHIKPIHDYKLSKRSYDVEVATPFSRSFTSRNSKIIVFKQDRLVKRSLNLNQCGSGSFYSLNYLNQPKSNSIFKRAPVGCPTSMRVLPVGVAADCSYVREKGGTEKALNSILSNINQASQIYETSFNVKLAVSKVSIQAQCSQQGDPETPWNVDCSSSYTISQRLSDFAKWRGASNRSNDGIGIWHLMTKCSTQPSVGIAWLGTLCQTSATRDQNLNQYVSGVGVSSIVPVEWKVVAHEIGHNFGAMHDCTSTTCPCSDPSSSCNCIPCNPRCDCQGQFLMHPLDNAATTQFSPGSINSICSNFVRLGSCLRSPDSFKAVEASVCGNGVKEGAEQCDCGLATDCNDPCCDAATCKLKPNAVCADGNDSCCSGCQLKANGTVCHPSAGVCDKELTCDGQSPSCPSNSFIADGTPCTTNEITAQCISGVCTSRDLQCKASGIVTTVSACPAFSSQCSLNCQDKNGACYLLNGNFLDGTPCGGGGKCFQGSCKGSNFFGSIADWIQGNPQYGYPIVIILALIALVILYSCAKRCCCNARNARNSNSTVRQQPLFRSRSNTQNRNNVEMENWTRNSPRNQQPNHFVDPYAYNGYQTEPYVQYQPRYQEQYPHLNQGNEQPIRNVPENAIQSPTRRIKEPHRLHPVESNQSLIETASASDEPLGRRRNTIVEVS